MKNAILIIVLIFSAVKVYSADSLNVYQQDFIELCDLIEENHPNCCKYFSKPDFEYYKNNTIRELETTSDIKEFVFKSQVFVSKIKDPHTNINLSRLYNFNEVYPLKFKWIDHELYIVRALNRELIGAKVLSINGLDIGFVKRKIKELISFDTEGWAEYKSEFLMMHPKIYELLKLGDDYSTINLKCLNLQGDTISENVAKTSYKEFRKNSNKLPNHYLSYWDGNHFFDYHIFENEKICYLKFQQCIDLQIINFSQDSRSLLLNLVYNTVWGLRGNMNFKKFLVKMFNEVEKKKIEHLIIDVRRNQGGSDILNYQLLSFLGFDNTKKSFTYRIKLTEAIKENGMQVFDYERNYFLKKNDSSDFKLPLEIIHENSDEDWEFITDKKSFFYINKNKNAFNGEIYVLTSNETFSSGAMLAVSLKDNNVATIVGEPIGIKPNHCGEIISYRLKNTGLNINISTKEFFRPYRKNPNEFLEPDFKISKTIDDYLYGLDTQLDSLIGSIKLGE